MPWPLGRELIGDRRINVWEIQVVRLRIRPSGCLWLINKCTVASTSIESLVKHFPERILQTKFGQCLSISLVKKRGDIQSDWPSSYLFNTRFSHLSNEKSARLPMNVVHFVLSPHPSSELDTRHPPLTIYFILKTFLRNLLYIFGRLLAGSTLSTFQMSSTPVNNRSPKLHAFP